MNAMSSGHEPSRSPATPGAARGPVTERGHSTRAEKSVAPPLPRRDPSHPSTLEGIRIHRTHLLVPGDFTLPPRCIKTGEPVSSPPRIERVRDMTEMLFIAGPLLERTLEILRIRNRPKLHAAFYISEARIRRMARWRMFAWVMLVVSLIATVLANRAGWRDIDLLFFLPVMPACAFLAVRPKPLWIVGYSNGMFHVGGCGKAFLDTITEERFATGPAGEPPPPAIPRIRVQGKYVIVTCNAVLPPRCVKTNQPVSSPAVVKEIHWKSNAEALIGFASEAAHAAMHFVPRPKLRFEYFISARVRRRIRIQQALGGLGLLLFIPLAILVSAMRLPDEAIFLIIAWISVSVCLIFLSAPIGIVDFKNGEIWIKGCGKAFREQLKKEHPDP